MTKIFLFVFCCCYIAPDLSKDETLLSRFCGYLVKYICKSPFFLVGDFNFPEINWLHYSRSSRANKTFLNFCLQGNLNQKITGSAHVSGSTLDLISVNKAQIFNSIFQEVYQKNNGISPSLPKRTYDEDLSYITITDSHIKAVIQNLLPKTSKILDGIPPFVIKKIGYSIIPFLKTLFMLTLEKG